MSPRYAFRLADGNHARLWTGTADTIRDAIDAAEFDHPGFSVMLGGRIRADDDGFYFDPLTTDVTDRGED